MLVLMLHHFHPSSCMLGFLFHIFFCWRENEDGFERGRNQLFSNSYFYTKWKALSNFCRGFGECVQGVIREREKKLIGSGLEQFLFQCAYTTRKLIRTCVNLCGKQQLFAQGIFVIQQMTQVRTLRKTAPALYKRLALFRQSKPFYMNSWSIKYTYIDTECLKLPHRGSQMV